MMIDLDHVLACREISSEVPSARELFRRGRHDPDEPLVFGR